MLNAYTFNQALYSEPPPPAARPHVILDGQYAEAVQQFTRVFVIGRDTLDNAVSGSYAEPDTGELAGSARIALHYDPAISSASLAGSVAAGKAAAWRISRRAAWLIAPQNAALELYDIITVTDTPCNQHGRHYRITGIKYEYNYKKRRYRQRLTLSAV